MSYLWSRRPRWSLCPHLTNFTLLKIFSEMKNKTVFNYLILSATLLSLPKSYFSIHCHESERYCQYQFIATFHVMQQRLY